MKAIINFFKKPYRWAVVYGTAVTLFFGFTLLDAFVIPKALAKVEVKAADDTAQAETGIVPSSQPVITAASYQDENIRITIETVREYNTTFYVADVVLSDASLLKTALAGDTYGRNIKAATSDIADAHNAIFAINGDYYGFRDTGYVLRNGVLYRNTASTGTDALVIDKDGNFSIVPESSVSAEALAASGAWQVLTFGPALVENGAIAVSANQEIAGKSMNSNPRTAIGQAGELHYIFIVSDGRTGDNAGLSLYQLAEQFAARGCTVAYNLDGGGSSSMVFNGEVVNTPVGGSGKRTSSSERQVSDIVYIGYE